MAGDFGSGTKRGRFAAVRGAGGAGFCFLRLFTSASSSVFRFWRSSTARSSFSRRSESDFVLAASVWQDRMTKQRKQPARRGAMRRSLGLVVGNMELGRLAAPIGGVVSLRGGG